jgi:hypothetical protein
MRLPLMPILLALYACAGNAPPAGVTSQQSTTADAASDVPRITAEQIAASGGATAWDVVDKLHPRWFRDQLTGKEVTVYQDNQSLGGAEKLRSLAVRDVAGLEYLDGQAAVRRWGPGVEGGVIVVVRNRS